VPSRRDTIEDRLRGVGFWRAPYCPDLPDPAAHVEPAWDAAERELIIEYLLRGEHRGSWGGTAFCRMCDPDGAVGDNGCNDYTDGVWFWPEGLVHYVRDHGVRPEPEFVAWALAHMGEAHARSRHDAPDVQVPRRKPIPTQASLEHMLSGAQRVVLR
jgi:hypothetical protein